MHSLFLEIKVINLEETLLALSPLLYCSVSNKTFGKQFPTRRYRNNLSGPGEGRKLLHLEKFSPLYYFGEKNNVKSFKGR